MYTRVMYFCTYCAKVFPATANLCSRNARDLFIEIFRGLALPAAGM